MVGIYKCQKKTLIIFFFLPYSLENDHDTFQGQWIEKIDLKE